MEKVDKIVCFGKNYLEHAKELGDPIPEKPVIFLKPPSILKQAKKWQEVVSLFFPEDETGEVHYECEIVLRLQSGGFRLSPAQAEAAIGQVSIGLDMTKRTLQSQLKKNGNPWEISKIFPDAAVIGPWIEIANSTTKKLKTLLTTEFSFELNQSIKQKESPQAMLFNPIQLIVYASQFFPLCVGDIIFTGTPKGVGKIKLGDKGLLRWGDYEYSVVWENK